MAISLSGGKRGLWKNQRLEVLQALLLSPRSASAEPLPQPNPNFSLAVLHLALASHKRPGSLFLSQRPQRKTDKQVKKI